MSISEKTTQFLGRAGLKLQKYSPELLIAGGIISIGTGMVLACKATLNADDILTEHKENMDKIHQAKELEPTAYTENDIRKDTTIVYTKTTMKFAKLYGPAIGFTVLGIGAILYSHKIMTKRVVALGAAYEVVASQFDKYREAVREQFGEETDRNLRYGVHKETLEKTEVDEKGKERKTTQTVDAAGDINGYSEYAKFFDDMNPNWNKDPETNLMFLRAQENYMNNLLETRGHVFLNEVYDALGIPRTQAGSVVGWLNDPSVTHQINFDIYDLYNSAKRDFVNGYEPSILLDFKGVGLIWDKI